MGNFRLQQNYKLAAHGDKIGREAMSKIVIAAVEEWRASGETYKGAMFLAGRLKAVAQMAKLDDYWNEQVEKGFTLEYHKVLAAKLEHAPSPSREEGR